MKVCDDRNQVNSSETHRPAVYLVTTAAQFVYGSLDLSDIALKYQVTNEPSILDISSSVSVEAHNYTVTFSGCDETPNEPYAFNSTALVYLGEIPDSAGGETECWSLDTHASFFVAGQPWSNNATVGSAGLLEVYTSPLIDGLRATSQRRTRTVIGTDLFHSPEHVFGIATLCYQLNTNIIDIDAYDMTLSDKRLT